MRSTCGVKPRIAVTNVHHSLVHMDATLNVDNKALHDMTPQRCGHLLEVCENQVLS